MKRTDTVGTLTNADRIPRDRYILRVLTAVFGTSQSSGNPMITVEFEVLSDKEGSDTVLVGDRRLNIAGKRIRQYYVTKVLTDESKTPEKMGRVFDLFERCGCPQDDIDENNPDVKQLENKTVEAILYSKETTKYKDPTPEQRAMGQRVGDPILDSNGNPVIVYDLAIDSILGPSSVTAPGGY